MKSFGFWMSWVVPVFSDGLSPKEGLGMEERRGQNDPTTINVFTPSPTDAR